VQSVTFVKFKESGGFMTKTVEQRDKDAANAESLTNAWAAATLKFQKDLAAPIFSKSGNVGALVIRYDKLQDEFAKNRNRKAAATDLIKPVSEKLAKAKKELEDLLKELTDAANDERATIKDTADDADAALAQGESYLKALQELDKADKAVFDRWTKVNANREKLVSDANAQMKKELTAAKAGMASANTQLNASEGEIRKVVGSYNATATDMNRQDIASAVRGFLAAFK
jgi:chromosome segregation ATPase